MADGWRQQISERSGKALQDALADEEDGEGEEEEECEEGSDDEDDELEDVDGSWEALDKLEVIRVPSSLPRAASCSPAAASTVQAARRR